MVTNTYKDGDLISVTGSWRTPLGEHEFEAVFKDGLYVSDSVIEYGEFVDYTFDEALEAWPPAVWNQIRSALEQA